MPLDQLTPYLPVLAVAAGALLMLWGQRDRLKTLIGRLWPIKPDDDTPDGGDGTEAAAHETYACLRRLLEEVEDCPNATDALQLIVLQALVCGADPPHYRVTWEDKP